VRARTFRERERRFVAVPGPRISGHKRDERRERRETNVNSDEGSVQPCGEMSRSPCSCHARGCSPLFTTTTHPGIPR